MFRRVAAWFTRFWSDVRPGPEARVGALRGGFVAAIAGVAIAARYLDSGFGLWIDTVFCIVAAGLIVLISIAVVPLLLTVFRGMPRLAAGLLVGFGVIIALALAPLGFVLGPLICVAAALFGATLASFWAGVPNIRKKVVTGLLFGLSLAAMIAVVVLAVYDSPTDQLAAGMAKVQAKSPPPEPFNVANPAEPGPFHTRIVYYGARDGNARRPEYNRPGVATRTVDASEFFPDFKGWKANLRKKYWGYGMDKLPLNATVWLPDGPGPFPLILMVHGNHDMAEFSEPGYAYLGELLASRGFIFASLDENFLNSGLFHDPPKQQAVRGWMLLEHLKLWRDWSRQPDNPLHAAIDFNHIALMGHSRGGEAVSTAVLFNGLAHYPDNAKIRFDYHFPIQAVVAIAPVDGQYKPAGQWRWIENVNYFTIQGANDADVSTFDGSRQFDHVRFTGDGDWFKSELYIYRANHGQFNTVWGRSDAGYPLGWFLHLRPLLPPDDQRRIAKTYLSAFMEATLHGRREYSRLFRDYRGAAPWLPDTLYVNRYQSSKYKLVAGFEEDADVNSATLPGGRMEGADLSLWKEGRIPARHGDRGYNGVFLGWNRTDPRDAKLQPSYTITLPGGLDLTRDSSLVLSLAALDQDAPRLKEDKKNEAKQDGKKKTRESPDFTVELTTRDGVAVARPLGAFGTLLPPIQVRFTKLAALDDFAYEKSSEPVFQTITIPLSAFGTNPEFNAARLKTIRLRFNLTAESVILLSKVGFE